VIESKYYIRQKICFITLYILEFWTIGIIKYNVLVCSFNDYDPIVFLTVK